jgi:hypothetical protein
VKLAAGPTGFKILTVLVIELEPPLPVAVNCTVKVPPLV